ncbi:MAG: alpha,6-mannosyltransferase, partial [Pseudonocardiales bacterium]|nr:alpha,6-mannosyltransferase [Pseudonocardiales bacterium]
GSPPPDPARIPRRLGLTGTLLMGIGALGAGALPVPNPLFGLRVISLPARNATAAIAITYAGMGMLVLAWLWIGRMLRARGAVAPAPARTQLARTGLLWALPLAVAPPMFSKDVYSYLAQSAITARGLDPYSFGPAAALGVDDPLTRTIPTIWRDTPAPYGPLFLMLGRAITALTGSDVIRGLFAHRILALGGVALLIWALPRLARRCHLDAGLVLWLGAANPLVLFHLVSGIHNEGLMIGLMLAGVELGLRALDRGGGVAHPLFLTGAVVVSLGAAVKLPAILALGFLGMAAARERGLRASPHGGPRVRDVAVAAAVLAAVAAVVFVALGVGSGLGFGWTRTLGTANVIRSWMSLSTDLGQLSGQVGILAGLGDHTDTVLTITRGAGGVAAAAVCVRLLLGVLRGRVDPVTGLGVGLGAVVLLGPVVHPWYLLWAAIPLAATRGMPQHRRVALAASALLAVMLPPTGADFAFRSFQLPLAILAGILILVVALLAVRRELLRAAGAAGAVLPDPTLEAVLVDASLHEPAPPGPGPGPGAADDPTPAAPTHATPTPAGPAADAGPAAGGRAPH